MSDAPKYPEGLLRQSQLARHARAAVARATGHRYPHLEAALTESMDLEAMRDLLRLIRNLQDEVRREKRKRITQPWRR